MHPSFDIYHQQIQKLDISSFYLSPKAEIKSIIMISYIEHRS